MSEHRHLQRLAVIVTRQPVFFITACVDGRQPLLAPPTAARILVDEWRTAHRRHGWRIGRYVIMPDHVHWFATPLDDSADLSRFVGAWKEWTAKRIARVQSAVLPLWQPRFFDHVLRSEESYAEKRAYVLNNPVRAGLVETAEAWPYSGWIDFE